MRIAGMGYRKEAALVSLHAALEMALDAAGGMKLDALATLAGREGPPLADLAARLGLRVIVIERENLVGVETQTRSTRIADSFSTGSVAEAVAMLACGPGASLAAARVVSPDGMATAAIAAKGEGS